MGHKRIMVTVLAAAALFGAAISGCNREREPRLASASQRRGASLGSHPQAELAEGLAVRPAEVLSASAHRMSPMRRMARRQNRRAEQPQYSRARQREQQYREREYAARSDFNRSYGPVPVPVVLSGDLARYEPLPEPIPLDNQYGQYGQYAARTQAYQAQSGPYYASAGAPPVYNRTLVPMPTPWAAQYTAPSAFISEPYTLVPSRTRPGSFEKVYAGGDGRGRPVQVHPSPELTMAKAQLQGSAPLSDRVAVPAQTIDVPLPTPESFPAPIPELELIRYSRAPAGGKTLPVAMTPAAPVRAVRQPRMWQSQIQRVSPAQTQFPTQTMTAPAMPAVTPAVQGWVASPTTAMRVFK